MSAERGGAMTRNNPKIGEKYRMKAKRSILVVAIAAVCLMATAGFVSAATTSSAVFNTYGGSVSNLSNILGSPDNNYARVYGSGGGQIVCTLSSIAASGSTVQTKTYGSGEVQVWVRNYDTGVWQQIQVITLTGTPTTYQTVTIPYRFNTVALAIIPPPASVNAYIDSVIT